MFLVIISSVRNLIHPPSPTTVAFSGLQWKQHRQVGSCSGAVVSSDGISSQEWSRMWWQNVVSSAFSEGASRAFSKYHYKENIWVNIFISLIVLSICFIPSLMLNSATVLKTKFGVWFCYINDPFCSAISVIQLLQRQFCSLDYWIAWEASGFCFS